MTSKDLAVAETKLLSDLGITNDEIITYRVALTERQLTSRKVDLEKQRDTVQKALDTERGLLEKALKDWKALVIKRLTKAGEGDVEKLSALGYKEISISVDAVGLSDDENKPKKKGHTVTFEVKLNQQSQTGSYYIRAVTRTVDETTPAEIAEREESIRASEVKLAELRRQILDVRDSLANISREERTVKAVLIERKLRSTPGGQQLLDALTTDKRFGQLEHLSAR